MQITSAQVVETSGKNYAPDNGSFQNYTHLDDHARQTTFYYTQEKYKPDKLMLLTHFGVIVP